MSLAALLEAEKPTELKPSKMERIWADLAEEDRAALVRALADKPTHTHKGTSGAAIARALTALGFPVGEKAVREYRASL